MLTQAGVVHLVNKAAVDLDDVSVSGKRQPFHYFSKLLAIVNSTGGDEQKLAYFVEYIFARLKRGTLSYDVSVAALRKEILPNAALLYELTGCVKDVFVFRRIKS